MIRRFFDLENPNDQISLLLNKPIEVNSEGEQKCGLHYYHLNYTVQQKLGEYSQCQYYHSNSCCKNTTITSFEQVMFNQSS